LTNLPAEIGNLINLQVVYLNDNNLTKLPVEFLKIKNISMMDETSYEINNMDPEAEFIILSSLITKITNLPITLKEIWLKKDLKEERLFKKKIDASLIKVPFGCEIKYFL
jgi:Leucine-rich repeat (LRR) protein